MRTVVPWLVCAGVVQRGGGDGGDSFVVHGGGDVFVVHGGG